MFDRISIRAKLIAIVAAPLAVIITLAAVGFVQRRAEAGTTRQDVRRLEAIDAAQLLQYELQREVLHSVTFLASDGQRGGDALEEQRRRTDRSSTSLEQAVAELDEDEEGVTSAHAALRQIQVSGGTLRTQVDERAVDWQGALELFGGVEGALPLVGERLAAAIGDTELAEGARSITALGEYASWQARAGALLAGAAEDGRFPTPDSGFDGKARFDEAVDTSATHLAIVQAESGPSVRVRLRNQMAGDDLSFFSDQVEMVRGLTTERDLTISPERWSRAVVATLTQLREISTAEAAVGLSAARDQLAAAENAARLYLAGALLAVLLAVGLAISVATSIVRPVRQLTAAADRVAAEQLPKLVVAMRTPAEDDLEHLRSGMEELEVKGGPELARLTASVNAIQEVAVDVATEQATLLRKGIGDMFVNLARRNQGLLDRQLSFIDELEAQEEDPDQLEHLFKLDHMATRMRRNAESLLILAGAEPNRRRGEPVPLTKVTLAAVGEIEHFARVDLLDVDEASVVSQAAADVAHLLSELMENATQFSSPESRVEVVGHRGAEGYTVSISDHGIGMSPKQMADANELLARPPLLGLTLARSLGFIVVSRLAARHGIRVRLVASPDGGVTSIVLLPASALAVEAPPIEPAVPDPGPAPSLLPPLVLGGPEIEPWQPSGPEPLRGPEPAEHPVTLEEAVPTGHAFAAGLEQVASGEGEAEVGPPVRSVAGSPGLAGRPTGPVPHVSSTAPSAVPGSLPTRRPAAARANGRHPLPPAAPTPPPAPTPSARPPLPLPPASAPEPLPGAPVAVATAQPTSAPGTEASPPPRLFGGSPPTGASPPPAANGADSFDTTMSDGAAPPVPPAGTGAGAPEMTAAGLVRRVSRQAGAARAVPGGEGGRGGATTSARSPDEVRSMLSRFQSGRQAGQAPPSPAGPTPHPTADERDT